MKKLTSQKKIFFLALLLIFLLGLILRILPTIDNNFYFTMDQGNEAVIVREILERHKIPLLGQKTSLNGVYHGPFWIYFISFGYTLFGGHPFGALLLLIILNLFTVSFLMWFVYQDVSLPASILLGLGLAFFWPFYDTSRYAFAPFPLAAFAIFTIVLLIKSLEGKRIYYIAAAIPVGLTIHTEIASFVPFILFYLILGVWAIIKRKFSLTILLLGLFTILLFFLPHIISELSNNFSQTNTILREFSNPSGVFSQAKNVSTLQQFNEVVTTKTSHSIDYGGIFMFILVSFLMLMFRPKNLFVKNFALATIIFIILSWIWFSSSSGWSQWHTVYISPILYITLILMLTQISRNLSIILMIVVIVSQLLFFKQSYFQNLRASGDPSLLVNELAAVDWVYQKANGLGFYVYSYLPSVYDYPYQYLFWWYGRDKYGYLPCEYSTYPRTPDLFVPGLKYYQEPKRDCSNLRFLIIEPDKNQEIQNIWLTGVQKDTTLLQQDKIGDIRVEKRLINK